MTRHTQQGRYTLKNPQKYEGDSTNVIFRSSWERKFMIFLDKHESILFWSSEEITVPYFWELDGKMHRYFPDFIVTMQTKQGIIKMMVEVKPYAQTQCPKKGGNKKEKTFLLEVETYTKNVAKWKAAEKYCQEKKWFFRIITERELFKGKPW